MKRYGLHRPKLSKTSFTKSLSEKSLEFLDKWWFKIPFLLYAFGFIIHSSYLSNYSFFDIEILQTRYIYVGSFSMLYLAIFILFISFNINFDKMLTKFDFLEFFPWLIRLPYCTLFIYLFIFSLEERSGYLQSYYTFNKTYFYFYVIYLLSGVLYFIWVITNYLKIKFVTARKVDMGMRIFFTILCIPSLIAMKFYSNHNWHFDRILSFNYLPFIGMALMIIILPIFYKMQTNNSKSRKTLSPLLMFTLIGTISVIISYGKIIYPLIPTNFGGAKPIRAIIYTYSDTLNCKIINESKEWILLKSSDKHRVDRIRISEIKNISVPINFNDGENRLFSK